jgi:NAD(P)H-dependent FMN reductase
MSAAKKVAIVAMSTRSPQIGTKLADLIQTYLTKDAEESNIELSRVNAADFKLPVYDEDVIPAMVPFKASFKHAHSLAWSAEISKYDAYIVVVPEYNYGLAGGAKNAIDYLYNEWSKKPAGVVSYGIFGGKKASEQAVQSLEGMKLRVAATHPNITFAGNAGPDLYEAMSNGNIGEDSKKEWEEKERPNVQKTFVELVQLINEPPVEEPQA